MPAQLSPQFLVSSLGHPCNGGRYERSNFLRHCPQKGDGGINTEGEVVDEQPTLPRRELLVLKPFRLMRRLPNKARKQPSHPDTKLRLLPRESKGFAAFQATLHLGNHLIRCQGLAPRWELRNHCRFSLSP